MWAQGLTVGLIIVGGILTQSRRLEAAKRVSAHPKSLKDGVADDLTPGKCRPLMGYRGEHGEPFVEHQLMFEPVGRTRKGGQ
jgi:hypothetical protein